MSVNLERPLTPRVEKPVRPEAGDPTRPRETTSCPDATGARMGGIIHDALKVEFDGVSYAAAKFKRLRTRR